MVNKCPSKSYNPYKGLHLFLRVWISLHLIYQNFCHTECLTLPNNSQKFTEVPGPLIFCGFTAYLLLHRCFRKICRGKSSHTVSNLSHSPFSFQVVVSVCQCPPDQQWIAQHCKCLVPHLNSALISVSHTRCQGWTQESWISVLQ